MLYISDAALHEAINDGEDLNMDRVYDAMDFFRLAAVKTREVEVETMHTLINIVPYRTSRIHRVSKKVQNSFCQNFVKFPPI